MTKAQENPAATTPIILRPRDFGWLIPVCARGLYELARARISFSKLRARDIPIRNAGVQKLSKRDGPVEVEADAIMLARIAFVLPRLSSRLPWRSDCLVQAIAGQNWLKSLGAYGEIQIGVENPKGGEFGAHAWLVHGGKTITGGEIERYSLLLGGSR